MKANLKNKNQGNTSAVPAEKKKNRNWMALLIILAALVTIYLLYNKQNTSGEEIPPAVVRDASPIPSVMENLEINVNKLAGRWQRTDGGYIIELKNPLPDGKIEAAYFNPNPIHVGRAGWQNKAGNIVVTVELQDANYPGSLYTLEFLHKEDRLSGVYFQAVEKVNYEVGFTRVK
jgi:hypothetical protein